MNESNRIVLASKILPTLKEELQDEANDMEMSLSAYIDYLLENRHTQNKTLTEVISQTQDELEECENKNTQLQKELARANLLITQLRSTLKKAFIPTEKTQPAFDKLHQNEKYLTLSQNELIETSIAIAADNDDRWASFHTINSYLINNPNFLTQTPQKD